MSMLRYVLLDHSNGIVKHRERRQAKKILFSRPMRSSAFISYCVVNSSPV